MYIATQESMQKGFWKVVDTQTGNTIRVVQTKDLASAIAAKMNDDALDLAELD